MQVLWVDWNLDVRHREKTFSGRVRIELDECPNPLVLDAERLSIDETTLDGRPTVLAHDPAKHTLSLTGIAPGRHTLEIRYRGAADPDSLVGMYVAPAGSSYVLTSMFFPTGSRRLLPAFEHPAIKTSYRLTLTTEAENRVIFNTAPESTREVDGGKEWRFSATPRMSAYLLYLGVGPFESLTIDEGGRVVAVSTSPGRSTAGRYAADRSREILAAYEEYYGIRYPLSKLDLVAIENFWAGAMENWGAITSREELLLVDPSTSVLQRRNVLVTIAHEIAHQWFGDLVTNAWWDDFWLNESFATYASYRTVQRLYPSEEGEKSMLTRWIALAFDMDSLPSTHPIHVRVDDPAQLGENVDPVTYGKGAAVLRMIESYIGEAAFRNGVSDYLRRHEYASARSEDLWNALGEAAAKPVPSMMSEWITRPGYPIVHVRWTSGQLRLRQERFRNDGAHLPGIWPIPLRISGLEGERAVVFESEELSLPVASMDGLRVDPGRNAFVRVHPEGELLDRMLDEFPRMGPFDQWGFVSDIAALTYSFDLPIERVLDLLERAAELTDELPIGAVLAALLDLRLTAHGEERVEGAARAFLQRQLDRISVEPQAGEPEGAAVVREPLAIARVYLDRPFARDLAARYDRYDAVPVGLRSAVATAFTRHGGPDAFEVLTRDLRRTNRSSERDRLIRALGAFEDPVALRRALDLGGGPDLRSAELYSLALSASHNPSAGATLFDWFRGTADALTKMWSGSPLMSAFLPTGIVGMGLDREDAVRAYFAEHTPPDAAAGTRLGLEQLALTMRLRRALRAG